MTNKPKGKKESCDESSTKNENMNSSDNEAFQSDRFQQSNIKNGLICPKSVRNNLKKTRNPKEKDFIKSNKEYKDESKPIIDDFTVKCIKKSITTISNNEIIPVTKINDQKIDWPFSLIKRTETIPTLIYSYNPLMLESKSIVEDLKHTGKGKKRKKHVKSKQQDISDSEVKNSTKKLKKTHKSKKKKSKDFDALSSHSSKILKSERCDNSVDEIKNVELPKSFLVSYSSDEEDVKFETTSIRKSPEMKIELKKNSIETTVKSEKKIEIRLKPTKSPGKSAWESSESELESEAKKVDKEIGIIKMMSPKMSENPPHVKESKSSSKSVRSLSHSLTKSHSVSRSVSRDTSYSSSRSGSYSEYSDESSKSYSRTRSRSKSHRRSRHRRQYSSSSSSYSSRYHSRSSTRSSSYSRSSRSYTRSRSRYKSSYSSRYRSRSRSRSSRSRSNSYYRSSYRRRKRSSSTDRFLNVPTRMVKTIPLRKPGFQVGIARHIDIGKKIDAIKESQKKAFEVQNNDNVSSLNIPLPPEKPKSNLPKTTKKGIQGTKTNADTKNVEKNDNSEIEFLRSTDYIGPQVSSDMAKRLGLDVKTDNHITKKDRNKDNQKNEPLTSDSFVVPTLDAAHMALQSRAYQHRLYNLQGSSNQEIATQNAQYYHPLYMSASSLSNNLTAIASAAVANEQLPASVAGSLAQAAVQRIMSSSNLTATYNTPSAMASPSVTLQNAFQQNIPSCGTFVANTPSGLIPISLLQQGGFQVGLNPLLMQQLQQQQALSAQFGQAISLPNQHMLSGINQFLLQASNQQALLQSLGVNAQAQLLGSPLNFQHTLLMAAQQQQQQQLFAAHINQATIQAAQIQAHIQAQARAVSLQNLQHAAQMQSSAQSSVVSVSQDTAGLQDNIEVIQKQDKLNDQMLIPGDKGTVDPSYFTDQNMTFKEISSSVIENTQYDIPIDSKSHSEIQLGGKSVLESDNMNTINTCKHTPRIIYNSIPMVDSIDISSPISKS